MISYEPPNDTSDNDRDQDRDPDQLAKLQEKASSQLLQEFPRVSKSFFKCSKVSKSFCKCSKTLLELRITQVRALERQNAALRQSTPHNEVEETEGDQVKMAEQENNAIMEGRCTCHPLSFFFFKNMSSYNTCRKDRIFESPAK